MKRLILLLVSLVWCVGGATGQRPESPAATTKPAAADKSAQLKFKAIWEPINYPADLRLLDVFFVNERVGWIAGRKENGLSGGFILQTKDGGDHWAVQLGDPQSSDDAIENLRFLDETHGWAVQGAKLVRTSDGTSWEDAGSLPTVGGRRDYTFTSATHGIALIGHDNAATEIYVSDNAGETWQRVYVCATQLEVNGLMHDTGCRLNALHFATPAIGYAAGGGDGFFVVAKTEDGGKTWKLVYRFAPAAEAKDVFFTSAAAGVTINEDKYYMTTDGGGSWKGATGDAADMQSKIQFPDSEVGWTAGFMKVSYTIDGGRHWNSRRFQFPGVIQAFSLPSRQRAYMVGAHGMIYRYRVVPIDYTAKGMLDAPMMPAKAASQGTGN